MNKEEYLTRLQYCISQLPPVEAQNTMQYYREYFDDAGEENFASVMAELGTPEQLAAKICSSYGINYQQPVNENNTSKAVIIAIIAVLTCPIWFTAGIVILSLIFSLFMVILSLIFAAGVVGNHYRHQYTFPQDNYRKNAHGYWPLFSQHLYIAYIHSPRERGNK